MNTNALPGMGTLKTTAARAVLKGGDARYFPGGRIIDASESRDLGNTGNTDVLRAGLLMGKITSSGKYAPSIIGTVASAYDGGTTLTVSAAVAAEIVRRIGTSGTLVVIGPEAAAGTVRSLTLTFSAVDTSTGAVTVTAVSEDTTPAASIAQTTAGVAAVPAVDAVADVQTMTLSDGTDGGTFALRYRGKATASLAYNVATADLQTAVRALHADLAASVVTTVGGAGVDYVITTAGVACQDIEITADALLDGAALEPASITHTTQGVAAAAAVVAVDEVQTITMSAVAGTFRVGYLGQWTGELAYNVSTANLQAALVALSTVGAGGVVVTGTAGTSYVLTCAAGLAGANIGLFDLDLSNLSSVTGDAIAGSFVCANDGSATPLCLIDEQFGLKVTDDDGDEMDIQFPRLLIGGCLNTAMIINYPTDTSLIAWLKSTLNAAGQSFTFSDAF